MVRLLQRFDRCENMETPVGQRIRFQHTLSIRSGTGTVVRLREAKSTTGVDERGNGDGDENEKEKV